MCWKHNSTLLLGPGSLQTPKYFFWLPLSSTDTRSSVRKSENGGQHISIDCYVMRCLRNSTNCALPYLYDSNLTHCNNWHHWINGKINAIDDWWQHSITNVFQFLDEFGKDAFVRVTIWMSYENIHISTCWFSPTEGSTCLGNYTWLYSFCCFSHLLKPHKVFWQFSVQITLNIKTGLMPTV